MDRKLFYSRSIKGRLRLLKRHGEFITWILYHGYKIELYIMDKTYIEVYYNPYTDKLEKVNVLEPNDYCLNQFVIQVSLADLFNNRKSPQ